LEKIVPRRKQWVFDPNSGGVKIPNSVKRDVEERIHLNLEGEFDSVEDIRQIREEQANRL
jgi:hypothetical protein